MTASADGPVTVVGRAAPGLVVPIHAPAPSHELIQIYPFHRDAVGMMMRDDVVAPELVHLQMNNVAVHIDPDSDYIRREGGMDQGHSIMRAIRAYNAMTTQDTAYVIRRGQMQPMMERAMITPRAILIRPDYMQRREGLQPPQTIPAPKAPKVKRGPVALAK